MAGALVMRALDFLERVLVLPVVVGHALGQQQAKEMAVATEEPKPESFAAYVREKRR